MLASIVILASCRTIDLGLLKPSGQISPLLPALEAEFDMYSLEKLFPNHNYPDASYTSTNIDVNTQTISVLKVNQVDATPNDLITLFDRDVKNNITNPYGEKQGRIICRIAASDHQSNYFLRFFSVFSGGTLNLLGMPFDINKNQIDIDIEIINNNNELVGRYSAIGKGKEICSLYYGHNYLLAKRMAYIEAFKAAMTDIKRQIKNNHQQIIAGLNAE